MSTNRISIFPTCMIELKLNSKILSMKSSYLKRFIYLKVYFTRVATKYEKQLLPGALLHLVGCDWLCPEALAGFATSSWPLKVAPVPPPASLRTSRQVQRGCGLARIGTTGFHKHKEKQKKKRKDGGKHSYEGHTVWITHLKATLQFLLACSALCLLEEGTPQLAHQHPSVELWGIGSWMDKEPVLTWDVDRILAILAKVSENAANVKKIHSCGFPSRVEVLQRKMQLQG